jgi:hypothetical protein
MKGVRTAHCINIKFDIGNFTNFFEKKKTKQNNEKFTLKLKVFGAYFEQSLLNRPKNVSDKFIDENDKTFS